MSPTRCATGNTVSHFIGKSGERDEREHDGSTHFAFRFKTKSAELWNKGKSALRRHPQIQKTGTVASTQNNPLLNDGYLGSSLASERILTSELRSEGSSTIRSSHRSNFRSKGASSLDARSPPLLPYPNSGAAAKASVAAQSKRGQCLPEARLHESKPPRCEEEYQIASKKLGQSLVNAKETESGVDLHHGHGVLEDSDALVIRKDPFDILPPEIASAILSYLDARGLGHAELVSRRWYHSASQSHAWKQAFFNMTRLGTQLPVSASGTFTNLGLGLGPGRSSADRDWKAMLRARTELNSRWTNGKAYAIYLEGHTDSVYCIQFDEHKIVTGSRDNTVRVWDTKTYRCIKMLGMPSKNSVDGRPPMPPEAEGQPGRPVKSYAFDASDTEPRQLPTGFRHSGSVLCLQYDDSLMVTGSSDRTCIMWDLTADYKPFRRLRSHDAGVLDICFDDKHLVSCSKDSSICLWARSTGERLRRLTGHRGPVNAVQLRGNLIVSASGDGIAKLWNLTSGLCVKEFNSKDRGMACVDFSLDARTILAGGNDQIVYNFDTSSGELVQEMTGHTDLVRSLHLDNANGRVISGSYDTSVRAYDLATGELIVAFAAWTTSWILSAKSDYRRIVAASQDSRVVIMDFGFGVPGIKLLAS